MKRTVRNFTKLRHNVRKAFLIKNKDLCALAFAGNVSHGSWKSESGRKLVSKLRKEIGYRESTISCDIFWINYCLWRTHIKNGQYDNK